MVETQPKYLQLYLKQYSFCLGRLNTIVDFEKSFSIMILDVGMSDKIIKYIASTQEFASWLYLYMKRHINVFVCDWISSKINLLQYLIRTPIPHGGDGHADDDTRPGQVRVHRVSEYVKSVISRDAAGRVGDTDRGNGGEISLHQRIPTSDLNKTSEWRQKQK